LHYLASFVAEEKASARAEFSQAPAGVDVLELRGQQGALSRRRAHSPLARARGSQ
jgi:hypothetical protein